MRRRAIAVLISAFLVSSFASAEEPVRAASADVSAPGDGPFVHNWFFRTLLGLGDVPDLPANDRTGNAVLTAELGAHPLQGAFATGFSITNATDWKGSWEVVTPGLFGQIDLTYIFLSGFWAYPPPRDFCFRIALGTRLGVGFSESSRPSQPGQLTLQYAPSYALWRPELMSFADVDWPLGRARRYAIVLRGAIDTSVNLSALFRWSGSLGVSMAWGSP